MSKGEMRQAPEVLLPSPRAILRDDDNAGAQDGRIDGETRMRFSPGKPQTRTRSCTPCADTAKSDDSKKASEPAATNIFFIHFFHLY
jgi:hypothetical protein